ncbi:SDR family oxidoreductase [uncultured Pontibacter sp.]|uniref:SDR family oxidoreductase n=1 Tax=uncultured Pontibacter sp. TaxID=453356 RepID=UPI0026289297|nr:SDR family oxidoreductase [uncultured Pontibacter sp.]
MKENQEDQKKKQNPQEQYPKPPYPEQEQEVPGTEEDLMPQADHGEKSYRGSGKLEGKKAVLTGGDSGIGRAVAIAFAREGADVLISYLSEHEDAEETAKYVEEAGKKAVLVAGDISEESHCKKIIDQAVKEFGQIDILVNNAAYQMARETLQDVSSEEWDYTFRTNIYAMFHLCKAAEPHMKPGSTIVNTTSVNAYKPKPILLAYAATKGAIQNFTAGLAQLLADKGIRVNCVAPGPIWTPLIPSTMPTEEVKTFGKDTPLKRAGQPAELAPIYVLLASQDSSYMTGSTVQVTGGTPTI